MTTMPPSIHPETAAAIKAAVRLGLESLRAEPPQRLGDWACEHFKLVKAIHHGAAGHAKHVRQKANRGVFAPGHGVLDGLPLALLARKGGALLY